MPRYFTTAWTVYESDEISEGQCEGDQVEVDNVDRPTGVLAPNGEMIWRGAEVVGFIDFEAL